MNDLFNSLISRRMVMDVLKGQISTGKDKSAPDWIAMPLKQSQSTRAERADSFEGWAGKDK